MKKDPVGLSAVIGATGIVYGDIGTSPLYAFEKSVEAAGSHDAASILGLLSLIFWALIDVGDAEIRRHRHARGQRRRGRRALRCSPSCSGSSRARPAAACSFWSAARWPARRCSSATA